MTRLIAGLVLVATLGLAALPAAAASSGTTSATGAAAPRVLACTGKAVVKPARYVLSCADANTYFDDIHWTTWGGASAKATATYVENTCTPSCVAGRFVRYPGSLTLSKPEKTKYGLLFSVVHYTYVVSGSSTLPLKPLSAVTAPSGSG